MFKKRWLRMRWGTAKRFFWEKTLTFLGKYPPLEPRILIWAYRLRWPDYFIVAVENPLALESLFKVFFLICYLRGFFFFESEAVAKLGLDSGSLGICIVFVVFLFSIRSPGSLVKIPVFVIYWILLVQFFSGSGSFGSFSDYLRLLGLVTILRPVLSFVFELFVYSYLRSRVKIPAYFQSLFVFCPRLKEQDCQIADIPGQKTKIRAFFYYLIFLFWVGVYFNFFFFWQW